MWRQPDATMPSVSVACDGKNRHGHPALRARIGRHREPESTRTRGELEVTAVSLHAYAYLAGRYALLAHGRASAMAYGPGWSRQRGPADPAGALPGELSPSPASSRRRFWCCAISTCNPHVVVPFDEIEDYVLRAMLTLGFSSTKAS